MLDANQDVYGSIEERLESHHAGLPVALGGIGAFIAYGITGTVFAPLGIAIALAAYVRNDWKQHQQRLALLQQGEIEPLMNEREFLMYEQRYLKFQPPQSSPVPESVAPVEEATDPQAFLPELPTKREEEPALQSTWIRPQLEATDIAQAIAANPQSMMVVGQPGAGKGIVVSNALRAIKKQHPQIQIWVVDPKADPTERWYWEPADKYLPVAVRPFTTSEEMGKICETINDFIAQFEQVKGPKLLVVDEALALKEKASNWFKGYLMPGFNALCSMGRSPHSYGWLISQSPNAEDFGVSGGVRNVYRRILIIHESNKGLLANGSTFFSGRPSDRQFETTGRVYFDSAVNGWGIVPEYPQPATKQPSSTASASPSETGVKLLNWLKGTGLKYVVDGCYTGDVVVSHFRYRKDGGTAKLTTDEAKKLFAELIRANQIEVIQQDNQRVIKVK